MSRVDELRFARIRSADMNRIAIAVALVLVGLLGVAGVKGWRYRQDSQKWHDRWLALHQNPGGRAQYHNDNERLRSGGRVAGRVVFLGASITEQLPLAQTFPNQPFVNRGASGQLVWQQLLRLDPDALELDPEAVVIKVCAINFISDAQPFEETQYYYAMMAERIRARHVKAVLATTVPVTRAWDRSEGGDVTPQITRFNSWVRDQARVHHDEIIDYASALADEEGFLPEALSDDGLHPNQAGRERMLATIRAVLLEGRGQPPIPETPPMAPDAAVVVPPPPPPPTPTTPAPSSGTTPPPEGPK